MHFQAARTRQNVDRKLLELLPPQDFVHNSHDGCSNESCPSYHPGYGVTLQWNPDHPAAQLSLCEKMSYAITMTMTPPIKAYQDLTALQQRTIESRKFSKSVYQAPNLLRPLKISAWAMAMPHCQMLQIRTIAQTQSKAATWKDSVCIYGNCMSSDTCTDLQET